MGETRYERNVLGRIKMNVHIAARVMQCNHLLSLVPVKLTALMTTGRMAASYVYANLAICSEIFEMVRMKLTAKNVLRIIIYNQSPLLRHVPSTSVLMVGFGIVLHGNVMSVMLPEIYDMVLATLNVTIVLSTIICNHQQ
jgi:hypothetical protein